MTNYVTIHDEYKQKFFQIPKVLFTNEKYLDLSNNARVVWAILRERASLSKKNNWYEKETGRVFFIFTNKELCEVTKIKSPTTISNIKQELESVGLIKQKRRPNRPSILYLLYPIVEDEDIYAIDNLEEAPHPDNESQSQVEKGSTKNGYPEIDIPEIQKLSTNNTDFSNTDLKDLDTIDTPAEESRIPEKMNSEEKNRLKESYFERGFYKNTDHVPKEISNMLQVFSRTRKEAGEFYNIILLAKKKVEVESDEVVWLENEPELVEEIVNAFSRSIRKIEQEQGVDNRKGYLYKSIYKTISDYVSQIQRLKNGNENQGVYFDWLEEGDYFE